MDSGPAVAFRVFRVFRGYPPISVCSVGQRNRAFIRAIREIRGDRIGCPRKQRSMLNHEIHEPHERNSIPSSLFVCFVPFVVTPPILVCSVGPTDRSGICNNGLVHRRRMRPRRYYFIPAEFRIDAGRPDSVFPSARVGSSAVPHGLSACAERSCSPERRPLTPMFITPAACPREPLSTFHPATDGSSHPAAPIASLRFS